MDTVVLDGVVYVKASALAKKFKYTPDYIGQLCRAKKVDARLVGRTWFVNPESMDEHRLNRHKKTRKVKGGDSVIPKEIKLSRKEVLPVIQNKTAKSTTNIPIEVDGVKTRKLSVAYEIDDETLLPKLTKKKTGPPKTIRIEPANAKKLKVKGRKTEASFQAEELQDVALSGKLKITSFSDLEPETEQEPDSVLVNSEDSDIKKVDENVAIEPKPKAEEIKLKVKEMDKAPLVATQKHIGLGEEVKLSLGEEVKLSPVQATGESKPETEEVKLKVIETEFATVATSKDTGLGDKVNLSLDDESERSQVQVVQETKPEQVPFVSDTPVVPGQVVPSSVAPVLERKVSTMVLISPLIATVLAFVCVLLIFSASTKVVVIDSVYESHIILQVANLLEIFNQ